MNTIIFTVSVVGQAEAPLTVHAAVSPFAILANQIHILMSPETSF